jgi:hypothetical protein
MDLASTVTAAEVVNACWRGLAVKVKSESHCENHTAVLSDILDPQCKSKEQNLHISNIICFVNLTCDMSFISICRLK